jgi:hypothetical protein
MAEGSEVRPRNRWFQFDLRLLFVVVAAVGVILAWEASRRESSKPQARRFVDILQVGDPVTWISSESGGGVLIIDSSAAGAVTEIGEDFVAIKDSAGERFIPLTKIASVTRRSPRSPKAKGMPSKAAMKSYPSSRPPPPSTKTAD